MTAPGYQVALTLKSNNAKTGPIPVSTTSATTCPDACPLKARGCYAKGGPLAIHWRKITEGTRGGSWGAFCSSVSMLPEGQLWRHNQAGDLPGNGQAIDAAALRQLVKANRGKRGFTYTHYLPTRKNLAAIRAANKAGFTVNLSADNLAEADQLAEKNAGPVVVVLPSEAPGKSRTPAGRQVIACPAETRDTVTCASCQLCARADRRGIIIGFRAHGAGKKAASDVARGAA